MTEAVCVCVYMLVCVNISVSVSVCESALVCVHMFVQLCDCVCHAAQCYVRASMLVLLASALAPPSRAAE